MNHLTLENFISPKSDLESTQYLILSKLALYRKQFNQNKLYPALAELSNLATKLEKLFESNSETRIWLPKQISSSFIKNKDIIYEKTEADNSVNASPFELIKWALPLIKDTIYEGLVIYEFVSDELKVESVGPLPLYKDEGYFIVPDNKKSILIINKYECSIFSSGQLPLKSLKTKLLRAIPSVMVTKSPEEMKEDLLTHFKELKNPAVYICKTDLDFPFAETIFPIAKRKLMSIISE